MSYAKGSGNKFTLRRTDRNIPVITQPIQIVEGISLCGQSDIDNNNPENLYFHIFGAIPSEIKLFIYGELFNQNFYTELGSHDHTAGTLAANSTNLGSHTHADTFAVSPSSHRHRVWGDSGGGDKIDLDNGAATYQDSGTDNFIENTSLSVSGSVSSTNLGSHTHTVSGSSASTGLTPGVGSLHTTGTAKQYFSALKIAIDGVDQTAALLAQAGLAAFGDGTSGHTIVTTGVELSLNPFILSAGQHKVTFSLNTGSPDNGGKVRYNLYLLA